jgi:hypothetical protein
MLGSSTSSLKSGIANDQANHATQHRSEAALLMTESGHSPGNLDYLIFHDLVS